MNNYNVNWNGLDRGHENFWSPDLWRGVLNTFALNSPVDLNDVNGVFYETLRAQFPSVQWVTSASDGQVCSVFREGREAWDSTGVVLFQKGSSIASITSLGKKVVEGLVSYADVLAAVALLKEEKGEHPFSILLEALRKAPDGRGLSLDDVIKVMHHYRPGDDINEVLSAPRESLSGVPLRRLRAILLLMTYAGLAIQKDGMYFAGHDPSNYIKITGDDLREAFSRWLNDENIEGSGKAASYIGALDSADVIAQAYCPNFKCPSVYEMPDSSLESLRDFISKEGRKEDKVPGSGLFCGLNEIPKSHWRDGYCIAAIGALIKFKAIFKNMHSADRKDQLPSHLDLLTGALKLFAEKRKEEEWCSDKADGDANKPRAGYVANKQLRVLSNTPADIGKLNGDGASNIKAWFKNYWNVADGKSWLEGLSNADLSGFGPYIAHLLQPGSPAVAKPAKFSNALEAAVKAVIKPKETGLYDERVNETLKFLGLIGFDWNEKCPTCHKAAAEGHGPQAHPGEPDR